MWLSCYRISLARERSVVSRAGSLIMVDDEPFKLEPEEAPQMRRVRFARSAAIPYAGRSSRMAQQLPTSCVRCVRRAHSERRGQLIDSDTSASTAGKEREGSF